MTEHLRRLIGQSLFDPDRPVLTHAIVTANFGAAVKAAAWQGYDTGRFTDRIGCPYRATTPALQRAWYIGYNEGRRVTPRPAACPVAHTPVVFTPHVTEGLTGPATMPA